MPDGTPYVALVNYTAHGTIVGPNEMLISGEWSGAMQRTVEAEVLNPESQLLTPDLIARLRTKLGKPAPAPSKSTNAPSSAATTVVPTSGNTGGAR